MTLVWVVLIEATVLLVHSSLLRKLRKEDDVLTKTLKTLLLDMISGWTMTSADKAENKLRIETFEVSKFNDTGYCKYSH